MWPTLMFLLLIAPVALHFRWRRQFTLLQHEKASEVATLRQVQEQAAGREQARQEAIFNSMIEGLLLLGNDGRILIANRAFVRLFATAGDHAGKRLLAA